MMRLSPLRGLGILLLGSLGLALPSCGDDDSAPGPDAGESGGTGAGSSGGGRGGTATNGGSTGDAGAPQGGAGAASSGGQGGADATGSGGQGGEAGGQPGGQGGAGPTSVVLIPKSDASALIVADEGGSVTLENLTLIIPEGALTEDTEITIRSFEGAPGLFVFEPDGLQFEAPITARFTYPASEVEGSETEGAVPLFALETASFGEPMELVDDASADVDADGNYVGEASLTHFSGVIGQLELAPVQEPGRSPFLSVSRLSLDDAIVPLGVQFGVVSMLEAGPSIPAKFIARTLAANREWKVLPDPLVMALHSVAALDTVAVVGADGPVTRIPPDPTLPLVGAPIELAAGESLLMTRQFECSRVGRGVAVVYAHVLITLEATNQRHILRQDADGRFLLVEGVPGTSRFRWRTKVNLAATDVTCVAQPSTLTALGLTSVQLNDLVGRFKAAWQQICYDLSNDKGCQAPSPEHAIINVLDPVLEVGAGAAERLEAAFPCGDGPVGKTLCGTAGAFAAGDYVFALATFGDDIPTADPVNLFQHAFVFDADGVSANNYVPPAAYPKDFFAGTDKWYQVFYTPQQGLSLKVVDARVSTSAAVSSGARLVIAGREFAAFIPRSELDGAAPGFRVSTFRHQGDYGLKGGPWDASYYPPLAEPLMPAAAGDVIVLPED